MNVFRSFAILGLLCSLGLGSSAAFAQPLVSPHQVQQEILTGNPQQALKDLAPVLKANPRSAEAHYLEAEALDASGQPAMAKKALQTAEKLDPRMPFAIKGRLQELETRLGVTNPHTRAMHHVLEAFAAFALLVLAILGFLLVSRKRHARQEMTEAVQALMGQLNAGVKTLQEWLPEARIKGVVNGFSEEKIHARMQEAAQSIRQLQKLLESDFDEGRWQQVLEDVRRRANLTSPWDPQASPQPHSEAVSPSDSRAWEPAMGSNPVQPGSNVSPAAPAPTVVVQQSSSDPLGGVLETALLVDALQPRQEVIEREVVQEAPQSADWEDPSRRSDSSDSASDWGSSSDDGLLGDSSSDASSDFDSGSDTSSDSGWDSGSDDGLSDDSGSDWN